MRWCGPEVEVEGIVSVKTGGCPEDCHFCSQSGQFSSPVRSAWLDIPSLVRGRDRDGGDRRDRVLHRGSRARSGRAADGADARGRRRDPRGRATSTSPHRSACSRRSRSTSSPRWACTGTTTTWRRPAPTSRGGHHAHLGRALGHPAAWCATPAWRCAAAASSAWARRCAQRAEFAAQLAELAPDEVPLNFLNPRPGTPFGDRHVLSAAGGAADDRRIPARAAAHDPALRRRSGDHARRPGHRGRAARRHQRGDRRQLPDHAGSAAGGGPGAAGRAAHAGEGAVRDAVMVA